MICLLPWFNLSALLSGVFKSPFSGQIWRRCDSYTYISSTWCTVCIPCSN